MEVNYEHSPSGGASLYVFMASLRTFIWDNMGRLIGALVPWDCQSVCWIYSLTEKSDRENIERQSFTNITVCAVYFSQ